MKKSRDELEEYSKGPEKMVAARAAELVKANEELRHELDQRKRAQEALKESAERYKSLVNNVKLGVFRNTPGPTGKFIEVNPAMEEITGYSREELLRMDVSDLYQRPQERRAFAEEIAAVVGKTITKELNFRRKDGTQIVVSDTTVAVRDNAGQVQYFDGILEDITERKRAEHSLTERVKELSCFYGIGDIAEKSDITLDELYKEVVNLLPSSWQYPEIACARVTTGDKAFHTENFRETKWKQSSDIKVGEVKAGKVEVYYLDERPVFYEGPFLREERLLLDAVAERLGRITERKQAEEKLEHLNRVLSSIRNVNQLISREKDRDRLLKRICDNLVEAHGYYNAWVALLDDSGGFMTAAEAGLGKKFLPMVERLEGGELTDCGQRALTQSDAVVTKDTASTCTDCPLAKEYSGRGAMTARLEHGGKVYGLLSASIPADFVTQAEERSLFEEVAGDIAFALHNLELEDERKRAEEALQESEERYRAMAEAGERMGEAIVLLQNTDKVEAAHLFANQEWVRITGYTPEELREISYFDLIHPRDRDAVAERNRRRLEGKDVPRPWEISIIAKDGTEVPVEGIGAPLPYQGRPAVVGYIRDITERKRLEEEIKRRAAQAMLGYEVGQRVSSKLELDELLSEIVTAVRDAFDYYAVMILLVNEEAQHLTMQSIAGGYADIFPKDLYHAIGAGMTGYAVASGKTQVSGNVSKDPHYVREADEETKSELAVPIKKGQKVIGVLDIQSNEFDAFDETGVMLIKTLADQIAVAIENARLYEAVQQELAERKRAQAEREALLKDLEEINRKLERSNQELQDFAYIASHDLREPLRKIASFSTLLQDSLEGKLDDDQQENFEFMIDGAKRMQTMIDDLLAYSRLTTKARPFKQVNLNDVIEDLKKLELATLLDETKGTIHVPQPLPPVHGDPSQIRQLLQNLVGNGLKFHREGVPPEITIRAHVDDNMVELEVQDNGIGIAEEYHEQVFTMFKRLHPREHYGGTGIGLAVCHKIVDRHGGSIGVKSTPGEGSTFWFTLPREAAQQTNGQRSNDHNG